MLQKHNRLSINSAQREIYKTLTYSDVFDYALTGDQLFRFLGKKIKRQHFLKALVKIPHTIRGNTIYYFLPHRDNLVTERLQKEKYSFAKREKTKKIARILSFIPTISCIGISGSLALMNAGKKSDGDLFFITSPHTTWITRFAVYILLSILGVRRRKRRNTQWTICANMFVDENHSIFPKSKRNLYLAHEIAQLLPVYNREKAFEKFLYANRWIKEYLPYFPLPKNPVKEADLPLSFLLSPFEYVLRNMQLWYMRKSKTRETLSSFLIAFHPIDYETIILTSYEKRKKVYGI